MKKFLNKTTALTVWIIFSAFGFFTETFWASDWWIHKIDPGIVPWAWQWSLPEIIQNFIKWVFGFLALIALIIFLTAWFMIMTAWWDDDKVKKGKTWMINAVIWLIVIALSYSIVTWLVTFLATWNTSWNG